MTFFHHIGVYPTEMEPQDELLGPRQICLDLMARYAQPPSAEVPSGGLVDALSDFGVGESAARAVISRLARRSLIHMRKEGRSTFYAMSRDVLAGIVEMDGSTRAFGEKEREWDGVWTLAVFSLSSPGRAQAHKLRSDLRWLGFGPLRDGVWISPHAETELGRERLQEFIGGDDELVLFRARAVLGDVDVARAFPLDEIRGRYLAFIERCRKINYRLRAGEVSDREALVQRTELIAEWRRFPVIDPDIPAVLLPSDWPRKRAREMLGIVDEGLEPAAARRAHTHFDGATLPVLQTTGTSLGGAATNG